MTQQGQLLDFCGHSVEWRL